MGEETPPTLKESKNMAGTDVKIDEKIKITVSEPKRWKVIFLNDDHTPMDFVVAMFIQVFKHSQANALELTMKIHNEGSGVAGVYTFEIAEKKAIDATHVARNNGHPLQIRVEEE